jgi:chromosome segregation ATPase
VLGNGAGEELERLQAEWRQLEQRRSQLSQRSSTQSSSHFSISSLQSVASASKSSPPRTRTGTDFPLASTESQHAKLEEEREALRAALSSRSRRDVPLAASAASMPRRAFSPPKRVAEDSRHRAEERERDREREWREKMRAVEEEREHMRIQVEESRERNSMLEKKINDGQREGSDLKTELQRAETAAKHDNDM